MYHYSTSCISMFRVLCVIIVLMQAAIATVPITVRNEEESQACSVTCGNGLSCCGSHCFSPSYFVCNPGDVLCPVQSGVGWKACGLACYDPALFYCCNGVVFQADHPCTVSSTAPTVSSWPTVAATQAPTQAATQAPTTAPTTAPTAAPTTAPTTAPTSKPTGCTANCDSRLSCCGAACFDPAQYACQTGNVLCPVHKKVAFQACGTVCFDPALYSCCGGTIQAGKACPGPSTTVAPTSKPSVAPTVAPSVAPTAAPTFTPTPSTITCAAWTAYQPKPMRTITFINQCDQDIWVGAEGTPMPQNGGWALPMGQTYSLNVPEVFIGGRFWPRTGCRTNSDGKFVCQTGDCDGRFECNGKGGSTPATLIEFTMAPDIDYYDMSLVDGYSIPVEVYPVSNQCQMVNNPHLGRFNCGRASCRMNTRQCPPELQVQDNFNHTYCLSICAAVSTPSQRSKFPMLQAIYNDVNERARVCCACDCGDNCGCTDAASKFCCSPHTNSPQEIGGKCFVESWPLPTPGDYPPRYDEVFKSQCPDAYSWQFDDFASTFQCRNADYVIKFCPY